MPEIASITPSLDGQVWLKSIRFPFLNRPLARVLDRDPDIQRVPRGGVFEVKGRSAPVVVTDVRASRAFTLRVRVADDAAARDMDLILASGDTYLVHVPAGSKIPGGYVHIGGTGQQRTSSGDRWTFELPCRIVAPPAPDVMGTTMTWGAVFNLYGSWGALLAANPTWGDLLAGISSPDDLVVL